MARIMVGSYVVCYPVGGYLSWTLQWLIGFQRLGHDVYLVEKSGSWPNACFDLSKGVMSDDCSYGIATVSALLAPFGLENKLCFVDAARRYYGLMREQIEAVFRSADLFVDISGGLFLPLHDTWFAEAAHSRLRVCVDGEPGYAQMMMEKRLGEGQVIPSYDYYYSVGGNIGTAKSTAPAAGKQWRAVFDPVNLDLFPMQPIEPDARFTTVMAWQSHKPIEFNGKTYGQKDIEFAKFIELPRLTSVPLEIAVAGKNVPINRLMEHGWRVRDSHAATMSFDSFREYIRGSKGEFTVCKNVFVDTNSGWFSDRSAAYLASGRPVVMQDTGFSDHLPCGDGLFAVRTVEEAAAALEEINRDHERHSRAARELAAEYLDTSNVLGKFLGELGLA